MKRIALVFLSLLIMGCIPQGTGRPSEPSDAADSTSAGSGSLDDRSENPQDAQAAEAEAAESCHDIEFNSFSHDIVDPARISFVLPPGLIASNEVKPHSYIILEADPDGVPVYAPTDMTLTAGAFYKFDESTQIYVLRFEINCEIGIWLDHLVNVSSKISDVFPSQPAESSGNQTLSSQVFIEAGELIGNAQPFDTDHHFDFGLYNTEIDNQFENPERYSSHVLFADCPYDYFPEAMRVHYAGKFGDSPSDLLGDSNAECRSSNFDVNGAISGAWFPANVESVQYNSPDNISIGLNLNETRLLMNGVAPSSTRFDTSLPTYQDPDLVTSEHCYESATDIMYFRMDSATEMSVYYSAETNVCPNSFPESGFRRYVR